MNKEDVRIIRTLNYGLDFMSIRNLCARGGEREKKKRRVTEKERERE